MQWVATTADEHVLCDDSGTPSEYRVRKDPVTGVFTAYDGSRWVLKSMEICYCQKACERVYTAERAHGNAITQKVRKGRYSKRESA